MTQLLEHLVVVALSVLHIVSSIPTHTDSACSHKAADVVFALDSSASIWKEDFKKQLLFVRSLIEDFPISQDGFHVGVLTYGHHVFKNFGLNEYFTGAEVTSAIDRIKYLGGGTNTGGVIKYAREEMFDKQKGGRDVDQIMVVITDGYSMNFDNTTMEASISKSVGIKMAAIGVGHNVDERELYFIASAINNQRLNFRVDDYATLETIKSALMSTACQSASTDDVMVQDEGYYTNESDAEHETAKKYCGGKPADIYFIVDASSSIWKADFYKMLQFISYTVDTFDIGPDKTRVGVIVYSDGIHPVITINNDFDLSELKERILKISHLRGGTETGMALEYLRIYGFAEDVIREAVAHIAIVLTDGQSSNTKQTTKEAAMLKGMGTYLYVIGIGQQVDEDELKALASHPEDEFLYTLENFDALASIKNILALKVCKENEQNDVKEGTTQTKECHPSIDFDVMYVFDAFSIGIDKSNVLVDVIGKIMTSTKHPRIKSGVLTHSCNSIKPIPLSSNAYGHEMLEGLHSKQSDTLPLLLQELRTEAFTETNGDRSNAANVAVLFIDGNLDTYFRTKMAIKRLTFGNKVQLVVVGVGERPDTELTDLADIPMTGQFLHVTDYTDMKGLVERIRAAICEQEIEIEMPVY